MTFDSRWKNPQGKDPEALWRWAQELISELRKGEFFDDAFTDNVGTGLTNAQLADMAAWTIKLRNAGTSGDPQDVTINGLTEETSIDFAADFLPMWEAGAGTMRKAKPQNLIGRTLIASGAISSATEQDVIIDGQAWDEVEFNLIDFVPATDNVSLLMRFSQSASFLSGASDYQYAFDRNTLVSSAAATAITLVDNVGNATNERLTLKVRTYRPTAGSFTKAVHWQGGLRLQNAAPVMINGWGELIANQNAVEDARFVFSSGNISSGFYYAVGHKYA